MLQNSNTLYYFDSHELCINYVKDNKIEKSINFKNNKFKITSKIKSKKSEDTDILDILQSDQSIHEKNYINMYPIDTICDLKIKISLLFSIPWYMITLYWYEDKLDLNNVFTSYQLIVNENDYKISFDNISDIDTYLYDNRDYLIVRSKDESLNLNHFILNNINTIYFIVFNDYIDKDKISNRIGIDYYYYNFVIKYFPMFTLSVFNDYIMYRSNFDSKYSNFNINEKLSYYNNINNLLTNTKEIIYEDILDNYFNYRIITFILKCAIITKLKVSIRNIFDIFHIGELNIILLYFYCNQKLYTKKNKFDDNIKLYKSKIDLNKIFLYLDNKYSNRSLILSISTKGDVTIQIYISDEFKTITMDTIITYVNKKIEPIIKKLNDYKELLNFNYIENINELLFKNINKCTIKCDINYKLKDIRFNNINNYVKIKDYINLYSNLFSDVKKEDNSTLKFYIKSGIQYINIDKYYILHINKTNYYSIYSSSSDMKEWNNMYPGLSVILSYSLDYLNIDIKKIDYNDLYNIIKILNYIINSIKITSNKNEIENKDKDKILKKLKEVDPVMFSFETSKTSHRRYAKICQKPFHPNIYTQDEIKDLPKNIKENLVEFKNMTTNEKVYYHCHNKKNPYLGFVVGEHPSDYCIPCCRIKSQIDKDNYKECLTKYKYIKKVDSSGNQYVLNNIENNRLSRLPYNLDVIFNKSFPKKYINTKLFYIYGISGLVNIINFCSNSNIKDIDTGIHKNKNNLFIFYKKGIMDTQYFFNYDNSILVYCDNKYYYPIINSLDSKIYKSDNDIIKYLVKIIDRYDSINSSLFFHFNYINKSFKVESIFVNNKNFIYGVMIKLTNCSLYIPTIYHLNNTSYKVNNFISNSIINSMEESDIIKFLKNNNFKDNISRYIYSNILKKYIGLIVECNTYEFTFLFKPINENNIEFDLDSIEVETIFYPIHEISEKIYNNQYSTHLEEFPLDFYDIYYKSLYKLILQEISYYFYENLNKDIRNKVINIIKTEDEYNIITVKLQELIFDDYNDIISIINSIFHVKKNKLIKDTKLIDNFIKKIDEIRFNFDNDSKYNFMKTASFTEIDQLFEKLFEFIPQKKIDIKKDISNILIPCKKSSSIYCSKKKLVVPAEERNKFISLFYNDIRNPFKNLNLLNDIMIILDEDEFTINPNEVITIENFISKK